MIGSPTRRVWRTAGSRLGNHHRSPAPTQKSTASGLLRGNTAPAAPTSATAPTARVDNVFQVLAMYGDETLAALGAETFETEAVCARGRIHSSGDASSVESCTVGSDRALERSRERRDLIGANPRLAP